MNSIMQSQVRNAVALIMVAALSIAVLAPVAAYADDFQAYDGGGGDFQPYSGSGGSDFFTGNTNCCSDFQPYSGGSDFQPYTGGSDFQPYSGGSDFQPYAGGSDFQPYAGGSDFQPYASGSDFQPYASGSDFQPYASGSDFQPYGSTASGYPSTGYAGAFASNAGYASSGYLSSGYGSSLGLGVSLGIGSSGYYPASQAYISTPVPYIPQVIAQRTPVYQPQPTYYPQPQQYIPQPVNNTSNYCTGNSCNSSYVDNSYVNNSINGSFNTNTNTTAPLYYAQPQPIVQYQFPQTTYISPTVYTTPTYYSNNTYCTITASPTTIQNGQATYLSWSSNGTSATLSDGIGYVNANGTLAARPDTTRTYVLTVYGPGGSNSCSTTVYVSGTAPYVSLSQIPYTGFDFGPVGNAIYWMGLITFAGAAAYLVLYFQGGALAIAGSMFGTRRTNHVKVAEAPVTETHVEVPVAPTPTTVHAASHSAMKDTMSIMRGHDGTPRIVINRS